MSFIFDMASDESRNRINDIRKEIFFDKEDMASRTEKRVIATGVIRFEAYDPNSYLEGNGSGSCCQIMEFFVIEDLYREVTKSKRKSEIEESIRRAFLDALPRIDNFNDVVKEIRIKLLDDDILNRMDFIKPDLGWLNNLDLTTETPIPEPAPQQEEKMEEPKQEEKAIKPLSKPKVFIVHGHDEEALKDLKLMLYEMEVKPIILRETDDEGDTLIEALRKRINKDTDLVVVLVTPDDYGYSRKESAEKVKLRPRQNVVLEMGMAIGGMEKEKIFLIQKGNFEVPSDVGGLRYNPYNHELKERLGKRLKKLGFKVDYP